MHFVLHAHKLMAAYLWKCKTASFFFEENIEIDVASLFPKWINALSNVLLISIFLALPTVIHILTQHLNSLRPYLSRQSQAKHSKYRYIISDTQTLINSVDTSSGKRFRDSLLAWNYAILQIDHQNKMFQ